MTGGRVGIVGPGFSGRRETLLVTVPGPAGAWSIFRPRGVVLGEGRWPKTWTCPPTGRRGQSPFRGEKVLSGRQSLSRRENWDSPPVNGYPSCLADRSRTDNRGAARIVRTKLEVKLGRSGRSPWTRRIAGCRARDCSRNAVAGSGFSLSLARIIHVRWDKRA